MRHQIESLPLPGLNVLGRHHSDVFRFPTRRHRTRRLHGGFQQTEPKYLRRVILKYELQLRQPRGLPESHKAHAERARCAQQLPHEPAWLQLMQLLVQLKQRLRILLPHGLLDWCLQAQQHVHDASPIDGPAMRDRGASTDDVGGDSEALSQPGASMNQFVVKPLQSHPSFVRGSAQPM